MKELFESLGVKELFESLGVKEPFESQLERPNVQ